MRTYRVIVIGGGHAGVEAAWAAANLLCTHGCDGTQPRVALLTLDPGKVGEMSCNPAIGGLAKGQLVREVDALGGLMGLAADAAGINFKVLNTSKGAAVQGPRAQCDKHLYARTVRAMLATHAMIETIGGSVDELLVEGEGADRAIVRVRVRLRETGEVVTLASACVVLTTGTFMRGLMHTGEAKTPGGRFGEAAAGPISASLRGLGFELGRLKTGTPPRLRRGSIDWDALPAQVSDEEPTPFSELSGTAGLPPDHAQAFPSVLRFPPAPQVECRLTQTTAAAHEAIRANLHRAPMYSGQIESAGPRYCPSIEDKVVRFSDKPAHQVFLEPESLETDWVYCNGISTSLPADVQEAIVRAMPGCERAEILRFGYAVEYDMVRPHQIHATAETKLVRGLFLAGQINGTSGYEEAAAQGIVAGINAALRALGDRAPRSELVLGRDEAYIGVLLDDLVTKTPVEPYRMFTSRAEHRLLLRADNAPERLTPIAQELGLLRGHALGALRTRAHAERTAQLAALQQLVDQRTALDPASGREAPLEKLLRGQAYELEDFRAALPEATCSAGVWRTVHAERRYAAYIARQRVEVRRQSDLEHKRLPDHVDYHAITHLRAEAREALHRFRPRTFGQASRLEGLTPADLTLLAVVLGKR